MRALTHVSILRGLAFKIRFEIGKRGDFSLHRSLNQGIHELAQTLWLVIQAKGAAPPPC